MAEAREAKGQRQAGDRKPAPRQALDEYAAAWVDGYTGRTSRGFTEDARREYRRALDRHVLPFFAGWSWPTSSRRTCAASSATSRSRASQPPPW